MTCVYLSHRMYSPNVLTSWYECREWASQYSAGAMRMNIARYFCVCVKGTPSVRRHAGSVGVRGRADTQRLSGRETSSRCVCFSAQHTAEGAVFLWRLRSTVRCVHVCMCVCVYIYLCTSVQSRRERGVLTRDPGLILREKHLIHREKTERCALD